MASVKWSPKECEVKLWADFRSRFCYGFENYENSILNSINKIDVRY
jgi:hypothetical protein